MDAAWSKTKLRAACTDTPALTGRKPPSMAAVRRAVASSTALETGQSVQELEQKLNQPVKHRFAHIKLADRIQIGL